MVSQPPRESKTYGSNHSSAGIDKRVGSKMKTVFTNSLRPGNSLLSVQKQLPHKNKKYIKNSSTTSKPLRIKQPTNPIGGSFSEEEDSDFEDAFERKSAIQGVLGLKKSQVKRKQQIDDFLKDDSFEQSSSTPLAAINKVLDDDLEDDTSFLDSIKDARYYEKQRSLTLEQGKAKKYIETLDEQELRDRALALLKDMRIIIQGNAMSVYHDAVAHALSQHFVQETKSKDTKVHFKRFGTKGTRIGQANEMAAFKVGQLGLGSDTGYYGPRGQEIIAQCLSQELESDFQTVASTLTKKDENWWIGYFGFNNYLALVVIPEVLSRLVAEDQEIPIHQAREVLKESTSYGMLKFPTTVAQDDVSDSEDDHLFD